MRIILFSGKGGVGKTTTSAATAVKCADLGYKTVVMSTDPAHSLGDCFQYKLQSTPTKIFDGLFGLEVDTQTEIENNFGVIQQYFADFMNSRGFDEAFSKEVIIFPGFDEMFGLLKIIDLEKENYDVLIIDSAPTGNMFRFLAFPEVLSMLRRSIMADRYLVKTLRPFQRLISQPLPSDKYYDQADNLYDTVMKARKLLEDSNKTTIRLVTMPQKIIVSETRRALTFLNLFGYHTDCTIVNQIIPENIIDPHFQVWKKVEENYLKEIEQSFSFLKIFKLGHLPWEPIGVDKLREVGNEIYKDEDPTKKFTSEIPFTISHNENKYKLSIKMPFVNAEEISLHKRGDVLQIDIGTYRRLITLPLALVSYDVESAKFSDNILEIGFIK
ncbi:MAG: ArsA family ATPase [Candidatus Methanoperedens sp.]|nr:ArsA family ATPase [Candidatus Methanoperedens sp.]